MSQKSSVCLFNWSYRYGAASYFIDELAEGFRKLGLRAYVLNPLSDDFTSRFAHQISNPPTFCLSLNAFTLELEIEGKSYHEHLNAPLVGLYIDDPLDPNLSMRLARQNHLSTHVSPKLAQLVRGRFSLPSATVYHGGSCLALPPSQERPIDLLLACSYVSPKQLRRNWEEGLPKQWQVQIEELIERAQGEDRRPIWELWEESGLPALVGEQTVVPRAEFYLRHRRRDQLLKTLGEASYSVSLLGEGWEACPYTEGHKLLGAAPYRETMELMGQAKAALHITPPFCAGSHERPLTAMLQGCATVVDQSPFFTDSFRVGKELLTYSWKDLSTLPTACESALKNHQELGKEGRKAVELNHTWKHRAAAIWELVNAHCNV